MTTIARLSTIIISLLSFTARAQTTEIQFLKTQVDTLTSRTMHGRGYVKNGVAMASTYIQQKFKEYGLKPVSGSSYTQTYYFPVNSFPDKMEISIDSKPLQAGADYIVDARSTSFIGKNLPVEVVDMTTITNAKELKKLTRSFDEQHVWILTNFDSCFKMLEQSGNAYIGSLPKGCFLISKKSKLTWDVSKDAGEATVLYVKDEALSTDPKNANVKIRSRVIQNYKNENIVGYVPGTVKDSFIVFSAHYDHLGMMGDTAMFPGASDNASGTAMMLYLASYFSKHPAHYSVLFIAFSGEEIGLLGSAYFVQHPLVPLSKIKFLTNIDIMGDASDGVTVVNATEFPKEYKLLEDINTQNKYLPGIYSRGKAANSDHYFFTEAGVPSFFIYSRGGKGYYHDIFDKGSAITFNHIDGMAKLMIDFIKQVN